MIFDVFISETTNGGDAFLKGRDLLAVSNWVNMPYLAMFGGNPQQSTGTRNAGEQAFDYWANALLFADNPNHQFNSETERTLKEVPLNSSGRLLVEQAIKADLAFMKSFAEVTVETAITGPDRLEILIRVKRPEQLQEQIYIYLWDGIEGTLSLVSISNLGDFNDDFNYDFNS